ncbi:MAG: InlB B-repeat-containing protein [Prevotella sp.]|nr:InlB B-repeat-containing protein [Prevotella sp.]
MKKRIMMIAALALAICNLLKAEDKVTVNDFKISAGETKEVSISLDNDVAYVAFQFDLYLPEGITVEAYSADRSRMPESTKLEMSKQEDGAYRFLSAAMSGEPIVGNSGNIVKLTVRAAEWLQYGERMGYFRQVKLAKADATGPTYEEMAFPITIVEPSVVTVTSCNREYGEANPTFEYTVTGGALEGAPEISCEATATSPVGEYPIIITQGTVSNYNVTYIAGTLTITKSPLTISAGEYTKRQYEAMPEFMLTYEGFKNNETSAVLTTKPIVTCDATDDSAPGEYPITLSGAKAQNYDISYINGTLIVTEPESYTLTYIVDGEVYKKFTLKQNETITPEPEPTKEGYTFSGWSEIPETMPAHDVTVNGTFSINSYTLTYMIDEVVYKQVVYEFGATITPEPQPEGDYVSFEWMGLPETMPAHDVTVTAVYETGIAEIMMMAQQGQLRIYSPNGKLHSKLQKGLNIVVMQDGTTKKVVVK